VSSGDDLRRQRRAPHDLLAGEKKGGAGACLPQELEHQRRALWVRTVIEGERNAVGTLPAVMDPQCWADARNDRSQGRPGVKDRGG
jgi:hypothetical protein